MNQEVENSKNEVALRRFAAVSFIEQKLREGFGIVAALRLGSAATAGNAAPFKMYEIVVRGQGHRSRIRALPF
jgi:hypothetical protein